MQRNSGRRLSAPCAASLILISCGACSSPPELRVSADTYCEKARYISATDAQLKVFGVAPDGTVLAPATWDIMKPYAQQVAENNTTYNANCLEYTKGDDNAEDPASGSGSGGGGRSWLDIVLFRTPGKG